MILDEDVVEEEWGSGSWSVAVTKPELVAIDSDGEATGVDGIGSGVGENFS